MQGRDTKLPVLMGVSWCKKGNSAANVCQSLKITYNLWQSNSTSEEDFCDDHPCQNKGADRHARSMEQPSLRASGL